MHTLDPRRLTLDYPGFIAGIGLLVMLALALPNLWVCFLRGGPIDDALYPGNPYRVRHESVIASGLNARETFSIIKLLPNGITPEALRSILTLTEQLQKIEGATILSPATLLGYQDVGDSITGLPYITEAEIHNLDVKVWQDRVQLDGSVWRLLIGENFDWISIALVPPTDDDLDIVWKVAAILENRPGGYSFWEKLLLKTEIEPIDPEIRITGFIPARWSIDRQLGYEMIILPSLGVLITFFVLWLWILKSFLQASLISGIAIVGSIWITRGSIWFMHTFLWVETHERIYAVLAYALCIVVGGSLALHKVFAFRDAPGASSRDKFENSRQIDLVIVSLAIIGILPFLISIRSLGVWQMVELGMIASVGIAAVCSLVIFVLPSVYLLIERWRGVVEKNRDTSDEIDKPWPWLTRFLCPAWFAISFICIVFGLATYLYLTNRIVMDTRPLEFVAGTLVDESSKAMVKLGTGNESISLMVRFRDPIANQIVRIKNNEQYPVEFAKAVWTLEKALRPGGAFEQWQAEKNYSPIRKMIWAGSLMSSFALISSQSFPNDSGTGFKPFPEKDAESQLSYMLTRQLDDSIKKWSHTPQGIRMTISLVIDSSTEFREVLERIIEFSLEKFPMLHVTPFGKGTYFPEADRLITQGEGWNVGSSLLMLIPCYALFIWLFYRSGGLWYVHPVGGAIVLVSVFMFSIGLNGCLMWLLEVPLSMSSAPITELTINAANDLGLLLLAAYIGALRYGISPEVTLTNTLSTTGKRVLVDCGLNCIAFLPLAVWSNFIPVQQVGWIMLLMLITCAVASTCLIPKLLLRITIQKEKEEMYEACNAGRVSTSNAE